MSDSVSLILLPGLDGTGILFRPLVSALPAAIRPIVVSYPPDQPLTYEELVPRVMEAVPQSEPFILLGESFSGPLAVMVAARRPAHLAGLILCATFVTGPVPLVGPLVPIFARAPAVRFLRWFGFINTLLGLHSTPELCAMMEEVHATVQPEVMAARARMVFQIDAREALRACDVPILYMAAGRDLVVPRRNLRLMQRIKPSIQTVTISAAHMVLQTRPVEAAGAIASFASSCVRNPG